MHTLAVRLHRLLGRNSRKALVLVTGLTSRRLATTQALVAVLALASGHVLLEQLARHHSPTQVHNPYQERAVLLKLPAENIGVTIVVRTSKTSDRQHMFTVPPKTKAK